MLDEIREEIKMEISDDDFGCEDQNWKIFKFETFAWYSAVMIKIENFARED